ncbi:LOW QUALITY PROTEIN: hypothetical protein MAR_035982 [Mya arenaria]|uniref:Uncharacterized protein n=1 Tax=Mya arenaria TaxID=6604 RepID=A0ABY7EQ18_MYAAR|nr:LOW QUALITY PROTEIN: hypothetical protein MAR_035982 [Mya arenaria]
MADLLARPLRIHTRGLKKLSHEEVLKSLKHTIDEKYIQAIQITERSCIITMNNKEAKVSTLIFPTDVITNVTLKDAPYEMQDTPKATTMNQFGDVIDGSLVRGKIENTQTSQMILNCIPILPPSIEIGEFKIKLFADNDRTRCNKFQKTDHTYLSARTGFNDRGNHNQRQCG